MLSLLVSTASFVVGPPQLCRGMRGIPSLSMAEAGFGADGLGSYDDAPNAIQKEALKAKRAEVEAAAAEVIAAAEAFKDPDTIGYAKNWTKRLLETGSVADSSEFTLLEECLVDSPDCERLEDAIKAMQRLMGTDFAATAC